MFCMYCVTLCVCVCLSACPQTWAFLFFRLRFLIPVCSLLVGIWTGRLLPSALSEEAAGPTVAQLPGYHWLLSVRHLPSSHKLGWARAVVSAGCPSLPLLGKSWHLIDERKRDSLSSPSTFLYICHRPPRGPRWNGQLSVVAFGKSPRLRGQPSSVSLHWKLLGIKEVSARGSSSFLSLYGFSWFTERRKYSRDFLLRFRFCNIACQRPVGLVLMEGVTDTKPGNGN